MLTDQKVVRLFKDGSEFDLRHKGKVYRFGCKPCPTGVCISYSVEKTTRELLVSDFGLSEEIAAQVTKDTEKPALYPVYSCHLDHPKRWQELLGWTMRCKIRRKFKEFERKFERFKKSQELIDSFQSSGTDAKILKAAPSPKAVASRKSADE